MLYASHGIGVPGVSSLTIDGSGSLDATDDKYAAIGGSADNTSGIIIIYGGNVTASGGNYVSGIGGAEGFDGELTISGVSLKVSDDESTWTNYDGTRKRYMKTN